MKTDCNLAPDDWKIEPLGLGFVGVPNACFGQIRLANTADTKLKVNRLTLNSTCGQLSALPVRLAARVGPQESADFQGQLILSPTTPPGEYEGQIQHAGHAYSVPVTILPDETLQFQPRRIYVKGAVGEVCQAKLQLTHQGNLPIPINEKAMLWLEAKDWAGHTAVASLRSADVQGDHQQFLNHVFKTFKGSMLQPITVMLERDSNDALAPGSSEWLRVKFTLPKGMEKGKTYHGFIKVNRFRFWFAVYCTGVSHASKRRN